MEGRGFSQTSPKTEKPAPAPVSAFLTHGQGTSACTGRKANRTNQLLEPCFSLAGLDSREDRMPRLCCIFPAVGADLGIPHGTRGSDPVMSVWFGSATSKAPRCPGYAALLQTSLRIYSQHLLLINKEQPGYQLAAIFGSGACSESKGNFPLTFFSGKVPAVYSHQAHTHLQSHPITRNAISLISKAEAKARC